MTIDSDSIAQRITCRVIYGDTDNMGIVYHANYFRWFETGRTEFFRKLGLTYKSIEAKGIFLPLSEAFCRYLAPARYDDLLILETSLDPGVRGGMKFDYQMFDESGHTRIARGYTRHACVNKDGHVIRPPSFLWDALTLNLNQA